MIHLREFKIFESIYNPLFEELINRLPSEIVEKLKSTKENPLYHPEGTVYNHINLVFNLAEKTGDPEVMLAAIFHDLGKIDTHAETLKSDGSYKISHIGHELKSLDYIHEYFGLYSDMSKDKEAVYQIVKNHMKFHLWKSGEMKKAAKRAEIENNPYFDKILLFSDCDENGRGQII